MTPHHSPLRQQFAAALLLGSALFVPARVRAQQGAGDFAAELRWASQIPALPADGAPDIREHDAALSTSEGTVSPATGADDAADPAPEAGSWSSPGRAQHRNRLMQGLGYSLAGFAAGLTAAAAATRKECQSAESGPSDRFGLLYVSAPVIGLGLSLGAIGSIRAALLRRRHGAVAPVPFSGPRGPVLAAFTTLLVVGALTGGMVSSAVCFS